MNGWICGTNRAFPDVTDGVPCCYGSVDDPGGCTCWKPVYAGQRQRRIRPAAPHVRQEGPCIDCAYRSGSPEKRGDAEYAGTADGLEALALSGDPFYCHQGLRRPTAYRHPTGAEIPTHASEYEPVFHGHTPYKLDGTPADLCAGWDARRRALQEAVA